MLAGGALRLLPRCNLATRGPYGFEHLLRIGKLLTLLPDCLSPIDENRQLALGPVNNVHLGIGLLSQQLRHTGGVLPGALSDRALSDQDLRHGFLLFE
jgi:hypothetical protein